MSDPVSADIPVPLSLPVTVMVVDDDPSTREVVAQMVRVLGYRVRSAPSAEAALSQLGAAGAQVVITDLMMPGMDGAELMRRIKERTPTVPVIIMSVVDSVDQAVRLLKSGADDYLTKPISIGVLGPRLRAAVERLEVAQDVTELRELIRFAFNPGHGLVLGSSEAFLRVMAKVPALARTDATVVIYGESGTGKELVARAIHHASRRAAGPLVSVSCATVPTNLWERELFGHVKGAFSDSGPGAPGVVQAADGGTLFLDEVGEIPLEVQPKLLRFLQEKEYRPVGSNRTAKANVRLVSATNRNLPVEVEAGRFREDLYYRLSVVPLHMPPLRERKEDVPHLASHFLRRYAEAFDKPVTGLSPLALQKLSLHDFPGNVRELENIIQQSLIAARYSVLTADDIPVGDPAITEAVPSAPPAPAPPAALPQGQGGPLDPAESPADTSTPYREAKEEAVRRFERAYVKRLLAEHRGNVSRAAKASNLPRKSLSRIMARHGIPAGADGLGGRPGRPRKDP